MPATAADPPAEAQLDREAAESAVKRLTAKIVELSGKGPGHDPALLATLDAEREAALKRLRHAELEIAEQTAAASGPITVKVIAKIRRLRRTVADSRPALMARMAEVNSLRAHRTGVENAVAALKESWDFKRDQREIKNAFVFPRDAQDGDSPPPARGVLKTPRSVQALASLERDLDRTSGELKLAQAALTEASTRNSSLRATLESWEAAIRAQGPAAVRALAEIPDAGGFDDQGLNPGSADIEIGSGKYSTRGMVS